jgi:hypothetical protein
MTATEAVITQLSTIEALITGVARACDTTPEHVGEFPYFVNFPRIGSTKRVPGNMLESLYTLKAELHVARGVLPEADRLARPFINLFEDAVWTDPTLAGTVTAVNDVRHEYVVFVIRDEQHLGIRFEIDVKIRRPVT